MIPCNGFGRDVQVLDAFGMVDGEPVAGQPTARGNAAKVEREIGKTRHRSALGVQVAKLE